MDGERSANPFDGAAWDDEHREVELRRLGPDEGAVLRAVRLRALADAPSAFGSTLAREEAFTAAEWTRRLASPGTATFVAVDGRGRVQAMATGDLDRADPPDPSVAHLVGMWVASEARGAGVGNALVARVVTWAEGEGYEVLRLCVTEGNAAAESLYRRHGFVATGCVEVRDRDGLAEIGMERRVGRD